MDGDTIFIIDSSSIIEIRRAIPSKDQKKIFERLTQLVNNDRLVYPKMVLDELERYLIDPDNPDLPYAWTKENETKATRFKISLEEVKDVLAQPQIARILDPDKPPKPEEADPYILALAIQLKGQTPVKVLTQEHKDTPKKLSLNSACGLLGIVSLPIEPFLAQQSIWVRP